MVVYGVAVISIYNAFVYVALHTTTATNAAVLNSAVPVFIPIIAFLSSRARADRRAAGCGHRRVAGRRPLDRRAWRSREPRGVALHDRRPLGHRRDVDWAFYSVILRWRPKGFPPLALLLCSTIIGTLALLPFYIAEHVWDRRCR